MVDVSIQPINPTSARPAAPVVDSKSVSAFNAPAQTPATAVAAETKAASNAQEATNVAARQGTEKPNEATDAKLKETTEKPQLRLSIAYNEEAQRFVYKGLDTKGATVSQYPTEDALKRIAFLRQAISDTLTGASPRGALVNTTL